MAITPSVERPATRGTSARRQSNVMRQRALAGAVFVTPAILFLAAFALGPFLFAIYVSLHDWNMLSPVATMPFRGLANYQYLLSQDPLFWQTFLNTVKFTLGNVVITTLLALGVALLLHGPVRAKTLWRSLFFLPYVTSSVAISIVWANIYHARYGLINGLLELAHLPTQDFLGSLTQALPSVIAVAVWQGIGYYMIIFLAGLQGIGLEVYEAAMMDGANVPQRFWFITLPLLRPTLLFVLVINTLGSLQVFDLPFLLTAGGPVNETATVVLYMYRTAFDFTRMGRATAMAIMLFALVFLITLGQLYLLRER